MRRLAGRGVRAATAVLAAVCVSLVFAAPAQAAALFPIVEPFNTATTNNPDWVFFTDNNAPRTLLTNEGDGWLRLTDTSVGFESGTAILDDPFSAQLGVVIEFDYATWTDNPAALGDGFSFFLQDGAQPATQGPDGGTLGYTTRNFGYIGVGFDEFGNFSADAAGHPPQPNSIAIRGAYNNTRDAPAFSGWPLLGSVPAPGGTVGTGSRAGVRHVRMTLSPAVSLAQAASSQIFLSLESDTGPGTPMQPVYTNFELTAEQQPLPPATFKIGFSGSTGGARAFHEIRNLSVNVPTDLRLTKTATPVVNPRQQVTYTLTAHNDYFNPVENAIVHDVVPAGLTNVTWTCDSGLNGGTCVTPSGSGNTIDAGVNLPALGATAVVTVHGTASDATAGTVVTNTAQVVAPADRLDLNPGTGFATAATQVLPFVDLAVTKTAGETAVEFGGSVSYAITVTNNGAGDAENATITDPIPAALDPASVVAPGCTVTGSTLSCPFGTLPAGESRTVTVTADVLGSEAACASGSIVQTATATTTSTDNAPGNDSASVSTACTVPVSLRITKSAPSQVTLGDRFVYHVVVTNTGRFAAPFTEITDEVPSLLSDVTWECSVSDGSDCTPASGTGSTISTTATIPVGGAARVDVTVTAAQVGRTTNTAVVAACPHCTDPGGPRHAGAAGTEIGKPILPISGQSLRRVADVAGIVLIVGLILVFAPVRLRRRS